MSEKNPGDTGLFATMVAAKQGWVVNSDTEFTAILVEGLTVNWNRYGYFLCPCRDSEGTKEADKALICPCTYARADIGRYGHCYCALYLSTGFAASGKAPQGIPDSRFDPAAGT